MQTKKALKLHSDEIIKGGREKKVVVVMVNKEVDFQKLTDDDKWNEICRKSFNKYTW